MKDDPVVERVRAARRRLVERCGGDPHSIYEWAKRREAEFANRMVGYVRAEGQGVRKERETPEG